jgi:hypothetical protein
MKGVNFIEDIRQNLKLDDATKGKRYGALFTNATPLAAEVVATHQASRRLARR